MIFLLVSIGFCVLLLVTARRTVSQPAARFADRMPAQGRHGLRASLAPSEMRDAMDPAGLEDEDLDYRIARCKYDLHGSYGRR